LFTTSSTVFNGKKGLLRICIHTDMPCSCYVKAANRWRTKVVSSRAVVRLKITLDRKRKRQHQQNPVAAAACNMHKCSGVWHAPVQSGENTTFSNPGIPQASSARHIDSRDSPSSTISSLLGDGTDGVMSIIPVSLTIASNVAVSVDLNSIRCVAVLTAGAMHGQPVQSAILPSHV
jgi:hypothetical protein